MIARGRLLRAGLTFQKERPSRHRLLALHPPKCAFVLSRKFALTPTQRLAAEMATLNKAKVQVQRECEALRDMAAQVRGDHY